MNVWGTNERSWRKARKRAVSPIIATILLVAITVVLAAVLYVLISGLTKGPGNTPIGTAFAAGGATLVNPAAASAGCGAGHFCYQLTIEQAGGGITGAGMNLQVKTAVGGIATASVTAGSFSILNIAGATVVTSTVAIGGAMTATSWTAGTAGTSTTPLASTMTIWVDLGTPAASPAGTGLTLLVLGVGSYSGTISVPLP